MKKHSSFFESIVIALILFAATAALQSAATAAATIPGEGDDPSSTVGSHTMYLPLIWAPARANSAPVAPFDPSPADESLDVDPLASLSWSGGDVDGDTVYYDVFLGSANPPTTRVSDDQSGLSYTPALAADSTYFWRVTAKDEHGLETAGPVWRFATGSAPLPAMVLVPAGNFTRGCVPTHNGGYDCRADELPVASIYLDAFYIDTTEVTNEQYALCVEAGGCTVPSSNASVDRSSYYDNPLYADYPVVYVNWNQANAYCTWAEKRLPTEAEWEKAARGSSDSRAYPWGDATPTCGLANYDPGLECVGDTTAVGSYPDGASPYGALDMAGNVYEWLNDWYSSDYYSTAPSSNPTGPSSGTYKTMHGGSSLSEEKYLRVAYRDWYPLAYVSYRIGFRCAASAP